MEWQPIETAPKDGTEIDLWMVNQDGEGRRVADAYFVTATPERAMAFDSKGNLLTSWVVRDGWFAPNCDYGDNGLCDTPRYFNQHPKQQKWCFDLPTHWRAIPDGPEATQ